MLTDPVRLSAVSAALEALPASDGGLQRLSATAARLLHTRYGFVSLVTDEREVLAVPAGRRAQDLPAELPARSSVCQHLVAERGRPLLVTDLQVDPRCRDLHEVQQLGMRSYAGFPVLGSRGSVLGGLCVADDVPRAWDSDEALLLSDLAAAATSELAALVRLLETGRARDAERRRADEQAALHRIAAAVVRGELPQRVLQQAADELVRLVGAEAALVLRFRPDGGTSVVVTAGPRSATSQAWSWFGSLVQPPTDTTVGMSDQPCTAVPIRVGGRTWGALLLLLGPDGSHGRVAQLEQLADVLSLVLVNAEAQVQLLRLARTDPLTGAPNRRVFEERLAAELARCARTGEHLLVALLDVDLFKQVNDRHGHDVGDAVLRALSERVGDLLDPGDLLARLGGDEWGLLVPDPVEPGAVLDALRRAVSDEPLAGVAVTVTVGGALVGTGVPAAEALRRADRALYEAKRRGRDGVGLS